MMSEGFCLWFFARAKFFDRGFSLWFAVSFRFMRKRVFDAPSNETATLPSRPHVVLVSV